MKTSTASIAPTLGDERYYFRTADKMRLQGCVHAITHEGQSLTLYCEEETLLDHYAQMLLTDLRNTTPQQKVEIYFPTSPDSLVERFNEALSGLSVQEASRATTAVQTGQIWVIHDPTVLADHELQLLGKLLQNLPGSNIRLVLLLAGATTHSFAMASLKRRMLRWDIELPSVEQALNALEFSEYSGQLVHMRRLLAKVCAQDPQAAATAQRLTQGIDDQFKPMHIPTLQSGSVLALEQAAESQPEQSAKSLPWKRYIPVRSQGLKIAGIIGLALVISTAMMMWTQPEAFGLSTAKPANAKPIASKDAIEITEWKERPRDLAKPVPAFIQTPVSPGPQISPQALATAPRGESKSSVPATGATRQSSPAKSEASVKTRINDLQVANQWLRDQPPQNYVIVYASLLTLADAQAMQKKYPSLTNSFIVQTFKDVPKNIRYTISSDTYESAGLAYRDFKSDTQPPGVWVRQVRDVQKELIPLSGEDRRM